MEGVTPLIGAQWRVKAAHPDRPDAGALRITTKDGTLLAVSGDLCTGVSAAHLASMIANGYVERVAATPVAEQETA